MDNSVNRNPFNSDTRSWLRRWSWWKTCVGMSPSYTCYGCVYTAHGCIEGFLLGTASVTMVTHWTEPKLEICSTTTQKLGMWSNKHSPVRNYTGRPTAPCFKLRPLCKMIKCNIKLLLVPVIALLIAKNTLILKINITFLELLYTVHVYGLTDSKYSLKITECKRLQLHNYPTDGQGN